MISIKLAFMQVPVGQPSCLLPRPKPRTIVPSVKYGNGEFNMI
jgi:hypothetical protein